MHIRITYFDQKYRFFSFDDRDILYIPPKPQVLCDHGSDIFKMKRVILNALTKKFELYRNKNFSI